MYVRMCVCACMWACMRECQRTREIRFFVYRTFIKCKKKIIYLLDKRLQFLTNAIWLANTFTKSLSAL